MKPLYQFIIENRVGSLPFTREEFKRYCPEGWDSENEFIKEIDDRIKKQYGYNVWKTFNGWVEGSWYGSDLDVLYDILCNVPLKRLDKMLGAGSNGLVIDCGDKVIKWFHKNTPPKGEDERFYNWCLEHPDSGVFPVVYKVGENYAVMEKLETRTTKCKKYDKYLGFNGKKIEIDGVNKPLDYWLYKNDPKIEEILKKDAEVWEIYCWGRKALKYLKEIAGFDKFSDLRLANIGERKNGDIVWFDI